MDNVVMTVGNGADEPAREPEQFGTDCPRDWLRMDEERRRRMERSEAGMWSLFQSQENSRFSGRVIDGKID
jgi:hypothetical protein